MLKILILESHPTNVLISVDALILLHIFFTLVCIVTFFRVYTMFVFFDARVLYILLRKQA